MLFVLLKTIEKDPINNLMTIKNVIHAYLPLSSCPSMTISSLAMMLGKEGPVVESIGLGQNLIFGNNVLNNRQLLEEVE